MSVSASVIIPAWNGARFIDDCLRSLREHAPTAELIVVDNGSHDSTPNLARARADHVIANSSNRGFAAAINQGVAVAQGEILLLLNQDTVALTDWLSLARTTFESDTRIGVLGFVLLYPDGSVQHAGAQLTEPFLQSDHLHSYDPEARLDFVTGAAMAIRRATWDAVGSFDEGYHPAYYEDVDYCARVKRAGYALAMRETPAFTHFESQSRPSALEQITRVNQQRLRFAFKHRGARWFNETLMRPEMLRLFVSTVPEWLHGMAEAGERLVNADGVEAADAARTQLFHLPENSDDVAQARVNLLQLSRMARARALTCERVPEAF